TADIDQLDSTLDALERDGFLSDARFAEHLVAQRAARFGVRKIIAELKQHAVDEAQLAVLSAQLRESELARARAVWQKKYGSAPKTPAERARQMRFLAMRGFEADTLHPLFKNNL
ncbi:RecX family transcriptional regulator, partial [Candidatus Glomeribacter gigasporarum]|uniref:RecX family transcriptional regulator n=1 Tax=Candidatus Glomeribacter gigasporarum TaxID=132144 RepID=UPI0005B2AEFC